MDGLNIGCASIMTPSKMDKTKSVIFYSLSNVSWSLPKKVYHKVRDNFVNLLHISQDFVLLHAPDTIVRFLITWVEAL